MQFQFPSNGKVHGKMFEPACKCHHEIEFQFPSNGKVHGKRPHFRPRRAVAPNTPKPNTNCAGLFFSENLPRKSQKPLWPLNPTRFVNKITLKVNPHLCSWTNYAVLVSDPWIAFVFVILREIPKNVNSFLRFFLKNRFFGASDVIGSDAQTDIDRNPYRFPQPPCHLWGIAWHPKRYETFSESRRWNRCCARYRTISVVSEWYEGNPLNSTPDISVGYTLPRYYIPASLQTTCHAQNCVSPVLVTLHSVLGSGKARCRNTWRLPRHRHCVGQSSTRSVLLLLQICPYPKTLRAHQSRCSGCMLKKSWSSNIVGSPIIQFYRWVRTRIAMMWLPYPLPRVRWNHRSAKVKSTSDPVNIVTLRILKQPPTFQNVLV